MKDKFQVILEINYVIDDGSDTATLRIYGHDEVCTQTTMEESIKFTLNTTLERIGQVIERLKNEKII